MAVKCYRKGTLGYHKNVLAFPSNLDIASHRIDMILATLSIQLKLCELNQRFFRDRATQDACGYGTDSRAGALLSSVS